MTLPSLFAARAAAGASGVGGKSVIFVFQQGGPPQFETYDPKPDAPSDIRTVTGIAQTVLSGVHFGDTFQQMARIANKFTVVRSFMTENGGGSHGGRVLGQSPRDGGEPISNPFTSRNLLSTILHHMLDVAQIRLHPGLAAISRLAEVEPIPFA